MRIRTSVLSVALVAAIGSAGAGNGVLPRLLNARIAPTLLVRADGRLYVLGGVNHGQPVGSLELYDPEEGSIRLAELPQQEVRRYATILDQDQILLCDLACHVYLPASNSWEKRNFLGGSAPLIRLNDGRILRPGGVGSSTLWQSTFVLDVKSNASQRVADLLVGRADLVLVKLRDGRVLLAGGSTRLPFGPPFLTTDAEVFDPAFGEWNRATDSSYLSLGASAVTVPDGRVWVTDLFKGYSYNPRTNEWTLIDGLTPPSLSAISLLPDGSVLVSGGLDKDGFPVATTLIVDPETGAIRLGAPLRIPRESHDVAVLPNGRVVVVGGRTSGGEALADVESFAWEPKPRVMLEPGYYVATSSQGRSGADGFWGVEVHSSGPLDGGLNFGGLLAGGGKEVGFGAFYIAEPQTVTARVNLQALPGTTGPLEVTLNVLDVNKKLVAGPIQGLGNLAWSQELQPGFYVLELRSSDRTPAASFQMAVTAPQLQAGGSAGASLQASAGVTGFVGFYLASKQDVTINLYNENTYGRPRGAGEVILTLYDAAGKVLQRVGPGATPP